MRRREWVPPGAFYYNNDRLTFPLRCLSATTILASPVSLLFTDSLWVPLAAAWTGLVLFGLAWANSMLELDLHWRRLAGKFLCYVVHFHTFEEMPVEERLNIVKKGPPPVLAYQKTNARCYRCRQLFWWRFHWDDPEHQPTRIVENASSR